MRLLVQACACITLVYTTSGRLSNENWEWEWQNSANVPVRRKETSTSAADWCGPTVDANLLFEP